MYLSERKIKTFQFIVFTIGILSLFVCVKWFEENNERQTVESQARNNFQNSPEAEVALYYQLSSSVENASDFFVRWWKSPKEDKYYIFLPSGVEDKKIYWLLQSDLYLEINQKKIQSGDLFELSPGEYEIEFRKNSETIVCSMEVLYSAELPSLFIETESGNLEYIHSWKGNEETGRYSLFSEEGILKNVGFIEQIKGRGNVSWSATEKKAYRIKLGEKTSVLGMPAEKQWILVPNFRDESLLKNKVTYDIANGLGLEYTPECRFIDLYINGEYRGNYLITEKIEIGQNRIAIKNLEKETEILNEEEMASLERFSEIESNGGAFKGTIVNDQPRDLTGGYLLELELDFRYEEEVSGFITQRGQCVVIKSPQYASYEQVSYIKNRYQEFENAIFSNDGKKYLNYIDIDSFVGMYLVEELVKNHDTSLTSQYLYKPEDTISEKFFAGPVWDYDNAMGARGENGAGVNLRTPELIHAGAKKTESDIWYALYQQDEFKEKAIEMFEIKLLPLLQEEIEEVIPNTVEKLRKSQNMNHIRWSVWGEEQNGNEEESLYEQSVQEVVDFLKKRSDFLIKEWNIEKEISDS